MQLPGGAKSASIGIFNRRDFTLHLEPGAKLGIITETNRPNVRAGYIAETNNGMIQITPGYFGPLVQSVFPAAPESKPQPVVVQPHALVVYQNPSGYSHCKNCNQLMGPTWLGNLHCPGCGVLLEVHTYAPPSKQKYNDELRDDNQTRDWKWAS